MKPGSLELLLKNHTPATAPHSRTCSPLSLHIQALHLRVLELFNSGQFSHPDLFNIIGQDFTANMENSADATHNTITCRSELIERHRSLYERFPGYRVEVVDMEMFEEGLREDVVKLWYVVRVLNHPAEGVRKEGVLIMTWVRRNGLWKSVLQEGLRGVSGLG